MYRLRKGDLVLVSNLTLKSDYNIDVPSAGYKVGIVIEEQADIGSKIFSERLYKILICDRIILLKIKDIQEKLNWLEHKKN